MFGECGQARRFLSGDDEDVNRCFWFDISECDHVFILVNDVGGGLAIDDLREDRGHGAVLPFLRAYPLK